MSPTEPSRERRRRRLATRVTVGVFAMLVPLMMATAGGVLLLERTTTRFTDSALETNEEHRPLNELRMLMPDVAVASFYAGLGISPLDDYERTVAGGEATFREMLARGDGADGFEEERPHIEAAYALWRDFVDSADQFAHREVEFTAALVDRVGRQFEAVADAIRAAEQLSWEDVRATQRGAARQQRAATRFLIGLALVAGALGVTIAYGLTRSLSRPLRRLRAGVERISRGDLGEPIALERRDELGELGDAIDAMARDLREAQSELQHQALHDALTGLPNRTLLLDRADQALHRLSRNDGVAALLLVDLDEFKIVNDTIGHAAGDALLSAVATRMVGELREVDTASRIGGDEFAVLVENLADELEVRAVADRVRRAVGQPLDFGGSELRTTASIGIAVASETTIDAAELLRNADLAMYASKQAGKNRCTVFEPAMHQSALERAALERALRTAVHREQLRLYYQPTIDLATGRITGVEALIRWEHPELGTMAPAQFIPLAEETGIIVPLGRWVLRHACGQMRDWQREDPERYGSMKMNVNLSARQLERPGIVADVRLALEQTGLDPRHLVLELTESMLAGGEELLERLRDLRALGVQIAVDDFGTGYSSLAYLRRFPINVLKIDRSFIAGIASRQTDATLASTIIELGRMLELTTVAEGIEDAQQLDLLRSLGCSMGQGYLFAKPLPADELRAFVAETPAYPLPELPEPAPGTATAPLLGRDVAPALLDAAADCLALIDGEANLQYASAAAQRLLGISVDEWIGRNVFDLLHPDDVHGVAEAWVTTVATPGVKSPLGLRLRHVDGTWMPVEIISTNMLDEPSVRGIVIAIRDRRAPTIAAAEVVPAEG
jgi:diguanylate cyclase (GGDEF)-like protein/PAS domain S-box-containing protein